MSTHANRIKENKSQVIANSLPKQQSNDELTFQLVDNRPEAITQRKLQKEINNSSQVRQLKALQEMADFAAQTIQPRENLKKEPLQRKFEPNIGLPSNLKSGIENLSGYAMDDVKVHYNSDKPAKLQAHAYAQGSEIRIAPGQEKHLPHEAWHVVQQKQGRVKPTLQMKGVDVNDNASLEKEADIMGGLALSNIKDKPNETLKAAPSLKSVFQRQIKVNNIEVDKDAILAAKVEQTKGRLQLWLIRTGMTATLKNKKKNRLKEEVTATESNIKATNYLKAYLSNHISELFVKYDAVDRTFENDDHLVSQLIQDVKLRILGLDGIVGINHHNGQFSTASESNRSKPLRIYRTTTRADWNTYLRSKSIAGLLHGHGGSLGQALDYYYKSKNSDENGPLYDNVIFEILFREKTASNAIDYSAISSGGEGGGPKEEKLTGKKEQNDIFGEAEVFSVNLGACSDLILRMGPVITRLDEKKGENSDHSERLMKLALKYGEYPPKSLTEAEKIRLDALSVQ